jgi:RNA polymerase sporulation-specific sigma factor
MALNKVEICGVDTSALPVLTNERMRELFPLVHGGDLTAREEFIRGNLRLVLSVIQRFGGRGENVDDLFQVGCIGLIKALDHFDVTQNVRFSTYAVPMIIGEIRRYLRDNNAIRVSRSLRDIAYKALKMRDVLADRLGREPDVGELAAELHVPREDVVFALEAIQDPISLFEPVFNDGGDALYIMDQITDEKRPDVRWLDHIGVKEAMNRLSQREQHILKLRFFQGRTQMEVAGEIGISQAQVSRLEKNALEHMRSHMGGTSAPGGRARVR